MAHTPGPWKGMTFPDADEVGIWNDEETIHIGQADNKANAALIAAAPELLAALEMFTAAARRMRYCAIQCGIWEHDIDHAVDVAIDTIAKSRGEDA